MAVPPRIPSDGQTRFRRRMWTEWLLAASETERAEWLAQFSPDERELWVRRMAEYQGRKRRPASTPSETPRGFSREELKRIDWDTT